MQYDSTMTSLRRTPHLATAYHGALATALAGMSQLQQLHYLMTGVPSDGELLPLAAATGLEGLTLELRLVHELIRRRSWDDAEGGP